MKARESIKRFEFYDGFRWHLYHDYDAYQEAKRNAEEFLASKLGRFLIEVGELWNAVPSEIRAFYVPESVEQKTESLMRSGVEAKFFGIMPHTKEMDMMVVALAKRKWIDSNRKTIEEYNLADPAAKKAILFSFECRKKFKNC